MKNGNGAEDLDTAGVILSDFQALAGRGMRKPGRV